eukprot:3960713-Prymnesium_polylepis.3
MLLVLLVYGILKLWTTGLVPKILLVAAAHGQSPSTVFRKVMSRKCALCELDFLVPHAHVGSEVMRVAHAHSLSSLDQPRLFDFRHQPASQGAALATVGGSRAPPRRSALISTLGGGCLALWKDEPPITTSRCASGAAACCFGQHGRALHRRHFPLDNVLCA